MNVKAKIIENAPQVLVPVGAVLLALLVGAVMLIALGADPVKAYQALFEGAFGNTNAIADTLVRATPLLFVGVGICISFRGGVLNIGGEGQLIMGALAATMVAVNMTWAPGWVIIVLALIFGFLGGPCGAALPAF